MTPSSGDDQDWELSVEGSVIVGRFAREMAVDMETFLDVGEEWSDLVTRDGVTAHVAIFETEESIGWEVLDAMERAAEMGVDSGIERWAIVADGVKRLAVKNRVEMPGLDVMTTDDPEEAFEWARR